MCAEGTQYPRAAAFVLTTLGVYWLAVAAGTWLSFHAPLVELLAAGRADLAYAVTVVWDGPSLSWHLPRIRNGLLAGGLSVSAAAVVGWYDGR